jgi:hypothetical protein
MHQRGEIMGASAYIGRVGGLAVALGIGAAVATGQGVAWADTTEPDPAATEPSTSTNTDTDIDTETTPEPPVANTPTVSSTPENPKANQIPSLTALTSRANEVLSSLTRAAERGIAVSTGGALTSRKATGQPEETDQAEAESVEPAEAKPAAKKSSAPADNIVERFVRRLPAVASRVDEPRTQRSTATFVDTAQPSAAVAQRTAVTLSQNAFHALSAVKTDEASVPVMTAAVETPVEQRSVPRLLTSLVSVFGLGALASNTPGAPVGTPIVMALLALGARRESESVTTLAKTAAVGNSPVAALSLTGTPTAAVTAASDPSTSYVVTPTAVSGNTWIITPLTGPGLNNTQPRFGVGSTDLGIMWDNGIKDNPTTTVVEQRQVLVLFGDTFSSPTQVRAGVWRNNMLFRSSDNMLSNGMYIHNGSVPIAGTTADDFSGAPLVYNPELNQNIFKQVIANERYAVGPDVTIIPTSAISVPYQNAYGSRQYATFMDVRSWDTPGRWTTNYSGVAFSDDNGVTWHVARESIRASAPGYSTVPYASGNQNFQQFALVKPPAGSLEAQQGWVYAYGTPSGRAGTVYLSRVNQNQILDASKYQYWTGSTWASTPSAAKPILPGTTSSGFFGFFRTTTYPSVGEMSVQYNEYEKQYIMLTTDSAGNVVMRKATRPEGPWSAPITLVSGTRMPGAYAPMIHPWSSTQNVSEADRQYLYWNLSTWNNYQVTTMRTDLSKV